MSTGVKYLCLMGYRHVKFRASGSVTRAGEGEAFRAFLTEAGAAGVSEFQEHARVAERVRLGIRKFEELRDTRVDGPAHLLVNRLLHRCPVDFAETVCEEEACFKRQYEDPAQAQFRREIDEPRDERVPDALATRRLV